MTLLASGFFQTVPGRNLSWTDIKIRRTKKRCFSWCLWWFQGNGIWFGEQKLWIRWLDIFFSRMQHIKTTNGEKLRKIVRTVTCKNRLRMMAMFYAQKIITCLSVCPCLCVKGSGCLRLVHCFVEKSLLEKRCMHTVSAFRFHLKFVIYYSLFCVLMCVNACKNLFHKRSTFIRRKKRET